MRFLAFWVAFWTALTGLSAQADPGERERYWRDERPRRELRRDDETMRRLQQERMGGEPARGRFTHEERQQLRRDIREHGRSVYRDRPGRN